MRILCWQNPDGFWTIRVPHDSGIDEIIPIGFLSKDQAARELLRRGYDRAVICDKDVMQAMREGRVYADRELYKLITERE
jgi:hypothetical protein